MSFKSYILVGLCLLSSVLFGGVDHGSGGNVVWHYENGKKVFQLLDYYQGRRVYNMTEDLGQGSSEWDLAKNVLTRLATKDAYRSQLFLGYLKSFQNEWRMMEHTELDPVNDYGKIQLEVGFQVKQVILQFVPNEPEEGRYLVDKDTWDLLDMHTKAGLILHEVIYREAIRRGQVDSINARYLNILVSSDRLSQISQNDYFSRMHRTGYDAFSAGGASGLTYRYYPWKVGPVDEILKFCLSLGPDGSFVEATNFEGTWNWLSGGAIGEAVRNLPPSQAEAKLVWLKPTLFNTHQLAELDLESVQYPSALKAGALCTFTARSE